MIRHIVMFKLKEDVPEAEKMRVMKAFKAAIEALPATIPFIREIEVGLNMDPDEKWHIALNSVFDNMDDVRAYSVHPNHVAAGKLLAQAKEMRACVNYEF
jgi:hypothetical protein